jgi:hypothetical protein
MISQIPGGVKVLDQRIGDGKTLCGAGEDTHNGQYRSVAQVNVYARSLGVALTRQAYDTHGSSERVALQVLLPSLDLEAVLIQADALHSIRLFALVLRLRRRLRLLVPRVKCSL